MYLTAQMHMLKELKNIISLVVLVEVVFVGTGISDVF